MASVCGKLYLALEELQRSFGDTYTHTYDHKYCTYYCAESLSWYSRARLKHSWMPESDHRRIMAESSSAE